MIAARRRRGAADRRKLQRQSGVDGGDAQEPRRRDATSSGASPCSARCASSASTATSCTPASRRPCSTRTSTALILIGDEMRAACREASSARSGSIASTDVDEATEALAVDAPARRRGAGQGVQLASGLRSWSSAWQGGRRMLYLIAEQLGFPGRPQPHPLHQLPRRRGERDRAADRPAARALVHLASCASGRARASRSAPTGRRATSPSAARRPWAAC